MKLKVYTDGGARGNPGPSACAALVIDQNENVIARLRRFLGHGTNNAAEYYGVIDGLSWIADQKIKPDSVEVFSDSLLLVNQLLGKWKIKNAGLKILLNKVKKVELRLKIGVKFNYIPRYLNCQADNLVNEILNNL